MVDAMTAALRWTLAAIGLLALVDPVMTTGPLATAAVFLLAIALLLVATGAATALRNGHAVVTHPTRRVALHAPLAQSDPDAPGHIRRRGPGPAAPAA